MSQGARSLLAAALALLATAWQGAGAQQPDIIGTWEWARKKDGCLERHVYRDDGTLSITSGGKRTENTFRMAWSPEPNGRYALAIATVRDDGGRDCDDSDADTSGRRRTVYVLFGQSLANMIQCGSADGADCTGLMRRTAK